MGNKRYLLANAIRHAGKISRGELKGKALLKALKTPRLRMMRPLETVGEKYRRVARQLGTLQQRRSRRVSRLAGPYAGHLQAKFPQMSSIFAKVRRAPRTALQAIRYLDVAQDGAKVA